MPSETTSDARIQLALDTVRKSIEEFHTLLATTADEVRGYLATRYSTWDGLVARVGAELGPLAAGRIDTERFAAVVSQKGADPTTVQAVERALETLAAVTARGEALCRADVPDGGSLHDTVAHALAQIGLAFSAARVVQAVRGGRYPAAANGSDPASLPFSRWTRTERTLAPPLVVRVQGSDLRAAGLAEFLDGRQRIVLVVEGECPPAPLVRLIAPGTFVLQTADAAGLDRLAAWRGPGIGALVPESAARFVHDPAAGATASDRLTIDSLPDRAPRKAIGGLSAAQQTEELELLRSFATRPAAAGPRAGEPGAAAVPGGGPAEPAEKLASWLLSQVDLSDLG